MDRRTGKGVVLLLVLAACAGHGPSARATNSAAPMLTATRVCDAPASVVDQKQPVFPDSVRSKVGELQVTESQVRILVHLDANGRVRGAQVVQPRLFAALSAAALHAAEQSTYSPETRHCKRVAGTFLFSVTYRLVMCVAAKVGAVLVALTLGACATHAPMHPSNKTAIGSAATPVCDMPASVADQAQPYFPDAARDKVHGLAQTAILVQINANGTLRRASVVKSSGIADLDYAALIAADKSTYSPEIRNCRPVQGSYYFRATFSAND